METDETIELYKNLKVLADKHGRENVIEVLDSLEEDDGSSSTITSVKFKLTPAQKGGMVKGNSTKVKDKRKPGNGRRFKYSQFQMKQIANANSKTVDGIAKKLNLSKDRVYTYKSKFRKNYPELIRGASSERHQQTVEKTKKKYTPEVLQFLRDNVDQYKTSKLVDMLWTEFRVIVNSNSLTASMNFHGIKRNKLNKLTKINPQQVEERINNETNVPSPEQIEKYEEKKKMKEDSEYMEQAKPKKEETKEKEPCMSCGNSLSAEDLKEGKSVCWSCRNASE